MEMEGERRAGRERFCKVMDVLRSAVAGVMVFIFLFIYPLYIRNRYGEVIEGKYQLYWMTALAGLAAGPVPGLIWLLADLIL